MKFSVVIPVKNQDKIVRMCLDSIYRHNKDEDIIVIDDGSTESSLIDYLESTHISNKNWKFLRNNISQGHTKTCELGIKNSECENIFFLNSDTIVAKNSLHILSRVLDKNENIAVVGPKTSSASGIQLNKEAFDNRFKWSLDDIEEFARKCEILEEIYQDVDLVNGFCFGVKRSVFNDVGGFDQTLQCYGNEKELLIRIRNAGYKTVYVQNSYVHHFGKMSYSHEKLDIGRAQKDADKYILKKHGRLI